MVFPESLLVKPQLMESKEGIKGDVHNCCGRMPGLRRASLPGSFNLPKQLRTSPLPTPNGRRINRAQQWRLTYLLDSRGIWTAGTGTSAAIQAATVTALGHTRIPVTRSRRGGTSRGRQPSQANRVPALTEFRLASTASMLLARTL